MLWEGITKLTSGKVTKRENAEWNNYERMAKGKAQPSARDYGGYRYKCTAANGMIVHRHKTIILQWLYPWLLQGGYLGIVCKRNKPRGFSNVNKLFVLLEIQSTAPWFPVWYYRDYQMVRDGPNPRVFQCRVLKFCRDSNLDLNCLTQAGYTSGRHRLSCGKEQVKFVPDPCSLHPEMWTCLCKTWNSR